jgi:ribonuclease HII
MSGSIIAGIDEVGRGPLAGPVVAACVYIPDNTLPWLLGVTDSKKLTKTRRETLAPLILENCICGIAEILPQEIDRINILQATFRAMEKAALKCHADINFIYVDGNKIPPHLPSPAEAVVKGDSKILEIGCASIIAKVHRDKIMEQLGNEFPQYGWNCNSGYGTKQHLDAIKKYGVTIHHRHSFAPVKFAKRVA